MVLGIEGRKVNSQLKSSSASDKNSLGRVLEVAEKYENTDLETLERSVRDKVSRTDLARFLILYARHMGWSRADIESVAGRSARSRRPPSGASP